ncbi:glycogen/starch/alpha-glucan phosphorylase [Flexithrix dorotheae]|uniref:glycogen/starch/alpha-glucan phosphorylase n=1 Tax=Flexithrix dorotheae TaxID=70993 RepID=UPI0003610575|nr:glycogen/starch/alpha-glucan phosphorylase [Flexithrix dorotheae]
MPSVKPVIQHEDDRTGLDLETLKRAFLDNLFFLQGRYPAAATKNDLYMALAYTIRDRCIHRWLYSQNAYLDSDAKVVGYLSAEFLMGPHLGNNLINLGLFEKIEEAMEDFGLDLKEILDQEEEPGLGNGGLGRLAACYLDSMVTQNIPAVGYGIRYEFGIFDQEIKNGWQVEITDRWLKYGNPWELPRIEAAVEVKFGGYTDKGFDENNHYHVNWIPSEVVQAVPYDTPILGYQTNNASILRLWKAEACESFDFQRFNMGNYFGAVDDKVRSENITKVLYPNDSQMAGKELRLKQQYFFVSATLQDVLRYHLTLRKHPIGLLAEKITLQLNDTHPAIAVPELMRLLVDVHAMTWDDAWDVTKNTFAYTNHTLLPEALEKWPMEMMGRLLPRHLEIILEINYHFLEEVKARFPGDIDRLSRMSIIDDHGEKYIRMANLATVGSYAVNGVAALHTELLTSKVLHDFYEMWPEKFSNKTNGVTPRRWVVLNNRKLTRLITDKIGDGWIKDLSQLKKLELFVGDKKVLNSWKEAKLAAKKELASYIQDHLNIRVDVNSIFDIQVKRIHEYKRQHLNVLHIVTLYNRIKENPGKKFVPRTFIFGGKAAPGYFMAKMMIKLINAVGEVVNNDPVIKDRIKVVFLPDFNVTNSQRVYPAADLSEQISMAGKEASGTGNMKFTMNGALTIGTLDGANVEIREEVGKENFFIFGLTVEEVQELKNNGYNPRSYYEENAELRKCLDMISSGYFSRDEPGLFKPLVDALLYHDDYLLLADYQSYIECQDRVSEAYKDQEVWQKMSMLNTARSGKFSSDRSIQDYNDDIWKCKRINVSLPEYNPHDRTNIKLK